MNKEDLVNAVASKTKHSKKQSEAGIQAAVEAISEALVRGEKVTLVGFGTFQVRQRAEREGRNPRTGSVLVIPARRSAAFVPGKGLRDLVAASKPKRSSRAKK